MPELKIAFEEIIARGIVQLATEKGYKFDIPTEPVKGKTVFDYIKLMKSHGYESDSEVYERADYVLIPLQK